MVEETRIHKSSSREATTGDQWKRSWQNLADAVLKAVWRTTETQAKEERVLAFPDTDDYHRRARPLKAYLRANHLWTV
jgi:hypothetical protein